MSKPPTWRPHDDQGGAAPSERLGAGFLLATARKPTDAELKVLLRVYEKQRERFSAKQGGGREAAGHR